MKQFTAMFIGHRECYGVDKGLVYSVIADLIEKKGVKEFLSGGMGSFDWLCAHAVFELKQRFPDISNTLVIPYLTFNIHDRDIFDTIVYPEGFEEYYYKMAIIKRNRYMVDNSLYAVCYVIHDWGGANKTLCYAKDKGLHIINVS